MPWGQDSGKRKKYERPEAVPHQDPALGTLKRQAKEQILEFARFDTPIERFLAEAVMAALHPLAI